MRKRLTAALLLTMLPLRANAAEMDTEKVAGRITLLAAIVAQGSVYSAPCGFQNRAWVADLEAEYPFEASAPDEGTLTDRDIDVERKFAVDQLGKIKEVYRETLRRDGAEATCSAWKKHLPIQIADAIVGKHRGESGDRLNRLLWEFRDTVMKSIGK